MATATKTITLPSKKKAEIRPGKGQDLLKAQRMAKEDPNLVSYGLIAVLAKIDGKVITVEEVLEMPLADVMKLQGAVVGDDEGKPAEG